jgi:hypothetical protein
LLHTSNISLLHLEAIGLEFFAEGFAAARRIYVACGNFVWAANSGFAFAGVVSTRAAAPANNTAAMPAAKQRPIMQTGLDVPRIPA